MPAPPYVAQNAERTLAAIKQMVEEVPHEWSDPRQIMVKHRGVQPPSAFYIEQQDQLQIQLTQATASIALNVNARVMLADGHIASFRFNVSSASTFTKVTTIQQLCEGFLLGVSVNVTSGTVKRGECYVVVGLQRFGLSGTEMDSVLVADYVTSTSPLGWPGGLIRSSLDRPGLRISLSQAAPAAGAEIIFTVPTGTRLKIIACDFTLVTSATVASRFPSLIADDGSNIFFRSSDINGQGATSTIEWSGMSGIYVSATSAAWDFIGLPTDLTLLAGWRLRTNTLSIQVGDQYGAMRILGEQWLEV